MPNIRNYILPVICLLITSTFLSSLFVTRIATAQSGQETWSTPVNLSNSGGTTAPAMVIDINGVTHVFWQDEFSGTLYRQFSDQQWSDPVITSFPFEQSIPKFIVNQNGFIHAFWMTEQNQLNYSFVSSADFSNPGSWSGSIQLAESAIDFDVVLDNQGKLHIAYVRTLDTLEFPAGIYHRLSEDNGVSWTASQNIYPSPYFRSLIPGQANVDLAAFGDAVSEVFLTWDNRPLKQVLYTRSLDGGISWEEEQVIDNPTEENPSARPLNIRIEGYGDDLLRLWQDGDPAANCKQYYQSSTDGGSTWSERGEMLPGFSACPQDEYYFEHSDLLMLMTTIQSQVYLLAWDGLQWSFPQAQPSLLSFQDPVTLNPVSLGCRKPGINQSGELAVVGCDTAGGGDIWITARSIGNAEEWFPPDSAWTSPELVVQSTNPISSPILLADSEGRLHAFWIGNESVAESSSDVESILYSRKDTDGWTPPAAVLQSPTGFTRQPAATIDGNDNLYVVWSGGQAGEIYFSRALGSRANSPAEWVEPLLLPSVRQLGSSPDLVVTEDGMIYVAYSIPLNEQRGVYLTKSEDGGTTWTEPVLAFDAVQAGWEMVDEPHIVVSQGKEINLILTKYSIPGGSGPLGVYATVSSDDGDNWTDLRTIVEKPVLWSDLTPSVGGDLFRSWLESSVGGIFFQYQISKDQGITWTPAASISTIGQIITEPALARDVAGQIYLVQAVEDANLGTLLRNWIWDGSQWQLEEDLQLGGQNSLESVAAAVSPQGRWGVIYASSTVEPSTDTQAYLLEYADRGVEVPAVTPTPQIEPTVQPTATPAGDVLVLPSPTPTVVVPTLPTEEQGAETNGNLWMGLAFGVLLAGVIAGVVFVVILIKRRAEK